MHTHNPEGNYAVILQSVELSLSSFLVSADSHAFLLLLGKMELLINGSHSNIFFHRLDFITI